MTTGFTIQNVKIWPGARVVFDMECNGKGRVLCHEFDDASPHAKTSWLIRLEAMSADAQSEFVIADDRQQVVWPQAELMVHSGDVLQGRPYSCAHRWKRAALAEDFPRGEFPGVWIESSSLREIEMQPDGVCRQYAMSRGGKAAVPGEFHWRWFTATGLEIEHQFSAPLKKPESGTSPSMEVWRHRYELSRWDRTVTEWIVSRESMLFHAASRIVWWKRRR